MVHFTNQIQSDRGIQYPGEFSILTEKRAVRMRIVEIKARKFSRTPVLMRKVVRMRQENDRFKAKSDVLDSHSHAYYMYMYW